MLKRFPEVAQITPVYAVIVLLVYSWTILWFFWKLPSWLYFMNAGEILQVFFLTIGTIFVETLVILLVPLLLCVVLPQKWFYEDFVVRGTAFVVLLLGYLMFFDFQFQEEAYPKLWLFLTPLVLAAIFLLVHLAGKVAGVARAVEGFANRATVLLYVSLPVSAISILAAVFIYISDLAGRAAGA